MNYLKKTKIIATIGPVSETKDVIKKLINAGMNVARLNFSHGDYEGHQKKIDVLKELISEGNNIAILLDTKGPEIRTGEFENNIATFKQGELCRITMKEVIGTNKLFSVSYTGLFNDVSINDIIRLDDGRLSLKIVEKDNSKKELVCEVLNNHDIKSRRNVAAPFSRISMPYISKKDEQDIIFGCKNDIDFIATSFTRTKEDVLQVRKILEKENKNDIQIIAKIENREGYNNAADILSVADGLMVARGDLGVEVDPEEVPIIQRDLVKLARNMGKICIVATHMLDSMQSNPTPTRAEVSDVANAIFESCDAVMLSGESASGMFPVESAEMEARIAKRMEEVLEYHNLAEEGFKKTKGDHNDAIAYSVANTVILTDAKLIVCFSKSGSTARRISYYRPKCPIISISPSEKVKRSLCLNFGVYGYCQDYIKDLTAFTIEIAKKNNLKKGDKVVLTGGNGTGNTNFMKIIEI